MLAISLVTISLVINMNYFSLWMMEPLGTSTDSSYQQYNITIQMVSGCFLLSSIGYYLANQLFLISKYAPLISRLILLVYGIALCICYWSYEVNFVSALVLGFGFHQIATMEFASILQTKWTIDLRFYLKNEVFAYFIMPIVFNIFDVGQTSLKVYALASGFMLTLGAILL